MVYKSFLSVSYLGTKINQLQRNLQRNAGMGVSSSSSRAVTALSLYRKTFELIYFAINNTIESLKCQNEWNVELHVFTLLNQE